MVLPPLAWFHKGKQVQRMKVPAPRFTLAGFLCRSFLLRDRCDGSVSSGIALIALFTLLALRARRAGRPGRPRRCEKAPKWDPGYVKVNLLIQFAN